MIQIPLTNLPRQRFEISVRGVVYTFRVYYNTRFGIWHLGITQGAVALVEGLAMVPGVNLLKPYNMVLDNLYLVTFSNIKSNPTREGLGEDTKLISFDGEDLDV